MAGGLCNGQRKVRKDIVTCGSVSITASLRVQIDWDIPNRKWWWWTEIQKQTRLTGGHEQFTHLSVQRVQLQIHRTRQRHGNPGKEENNQEVWQQLQYYDFLQYNHINFAAGEHLSEYIRQNLKTVVVSSVSSPSIIQRQILSVFLSQYLQIQIQNLKEPPNKNVRKSLILKFITANPKSSEINTTF